MDFIKNKEKIISNILDSVSFKNVRFFISLAIVSPTPKKPLMLENTSKERCLNYPLQILKCVLSIIFEKLKSFNQNFCEGISSILIEKAFFFKMKPRKLMEIYSPVVLSNWSCPASHWASTNFEAHLSLYFEDRRAEVKHEGQSFATLFSFGYGKICWNCCIRVITPA